MGENTLVGSQASGNWMIRTKGFSHRMRLQALLRGKDASTRLADG